MSTKIIDYQIVERGWVQGEITKGWQPFFGPITDHHGDVIQAMVKYEPEESATITTFTEMANLTQAIDEAEKRQAELRKELAMTNGLLRDMLRTESLSLEAVRARIEAIDIALLGGQPVSFGRPNDPLVKSGNVLAHFHVGHGEAKCGSRQEGQALTSDLKFVTCTECLNRMGFISKGMGLVIYASTGERRVMKITEDTP